MLNIFNTSKNLKVCDTSVLIDGRIVGIIESGFWEGEIIVPQFVIEELHALVDSKNEYKNKKGHRGLKILGEIQNLLKVEISQKQPNEILKIDGVDLKLVWLCKEIEAKLLTLDFDLNMIAKKSGIIVLNINDLNNAIKPFYMSGDILEVRITRHGKFENQGIGNLDDGTIVFIKNGYESFDKIVKVIVTNVIQSPSGRIIFSTLLR